MVQRLRSVACKEQQAAHQQALALRKERKRLAKELEQQRTSELKELYLERTEFEVLTELGVSYKKWLRRSRIYITTNPGEPLKPLVRGFWRRTFRE